MSNKAHTIEEKLDLIEKQRKYTPNEIAQMWGELEVLAKCNPTEAQEKLDLLNTSHIRNKKDFKQHIIQIKNVINPTSTNLYTSFFKSIYVFDSQKDWKQALNLISEPFSKFRKDNESKVLETPNFGFPIRHKNGSTYIGGKVDKYNNLKESADRRASPVIFKIIKIDENNFLPIIIWMEGDFLPNGFDIIKKVRKENKVYEQEKPNQRIIDDFFKRFDKKDYVKVEK